MPTPYPVPRRFRFYALAGLGLLGLGTAALRPAADDTEVLRRLVVGVQQFYQKARPETAYLHLDKAVYTAGETVWMRAYVVDAARHQLDTLSKVLHVELISDRQQVMSRRNLELTGGLATGDLALADTLAPGTYLLRAYTGWMRNAGPDFFYSRRLQVWPAAQSEAVPENRTAFRRVTAQARQNTARVGAAPDVQFFPEGGNLVAGLENVVAFKALDYAGSGLDLKGQVLDDENRPVADFSSRHGGMGSFRFTPVEGRRYHAVISTPAVGPRPVLLPAVQASGYVLRVVPTAEAFEVTIRQHGIGSGPVLLLGQVAGTVGYIGRGQVQGSEAFAARIPKQKFAGGIVHFTLFDGQGRPLAERLAFAREPALRVTVAPDRASYGPHQPVRLRLTVADAAGQPVAAQLSLAVADAGATNAGADNIAARLLLTADLAGYVEDPGYYFQNPTPEVNQALDDLLLTQGWRRFAWEKVLAGQGPAQEFGVERSIGLLGQVTRPDGQPLAQSPLSFLQAKPVKQFISAVADADGQFLFNGFAGCDTVQATLQARTERGRSNTRLVLDAGPPVPGRPLPFLPAAAAPALAAAVQRSQEQQASEREFGLIAGKNIQLGNVSVVARRDAVPDARRLYSSSSATIIKMDDVSSAKNGETLLQSLRSRVPGVEISGTEPNMQVSMRGNRSLAGGNAPLILLDGVPTTIDALSFYQAADVESVEILKPGQATIFGSRGADGVLAVYTRRGNINYDRRQEVVPGVLAVRLPGYNCPKQFYAPRYGPGAPAPTRPDTRRSTLYWNPAVLTDATGQAELTFYTSDATGAFQITTEGLAKDGQPALGSSSLRVQ